MISKGNHVKFMPPPPPDFLLLAISEEANTSVGTRDESNESEASQALMFCFDNAFLEKSCFVVDLVPFFRPPYAFLCS